MSDPITIDKHGLFAALNAAAARFLHETAPDLPQLSWTITCFYVDMPRLAGYIENWPHTDCAGVAQQWAEALGLGPAADTDYGTRQFVGTNNGFDVQIWYVADRDVFDRETKS